MFTLMFCVLCGVFFYKIMGAFLKASWGIIKIGFYILAAPVIIAAFCVSGFAVITVIVCVFLGFITLLGLF